MMTKRQGEGRMWSSGGCFPCARKGRSTYCSQSSCSNSECSLGSTCKAITSGESRAANSIPWRVMLLQRSRPGARLVCPNLAAGKQCHRVIVTAHEREERRCQGNEKQSKPGSFQKFRNQHDSG